MLIKLYIFLIPIVNAFNLSSIFTFPMIIGIINIFSLAIFNKKIKLHYIDYLFLVMIFLTIISILLNIENIDIKVIFHTLSIWIVIIIFYYSTYISILKVNIDDILSIFFISYMLTILFALFEFYIINFTQISLDSYIPRPTTFEYNPLFLSIGFIRARGFFEESGHFASYMAIAAPIIYYYLAYINKSKIKMYFFVLSTIIAIFASFSVALIIFLPFGISLTYMLFIFKKGIKIDKKLILLLILFIILIILAIVYVDFTSFLYDEVFGRKFGGNSYSDRSNRIFENVDIVMNGDILHLLFGYGPASYIHFGIKAAVNVYINFLRDYGILFTLLFLYLNLHILYSLFSSKNRLAYFLFISIVEMNLFFLSIPNYFYPHFFLLFAFYSYLNTEKKHVYNL